jgi:hypothetical protein
MKTYIAIVAAVVAATISPLGRASGRADGLPCARASVAPPAEAIVQELPLYPFQLYKGGVSGFVRAEMDVDENGKVVMVKIIEGSHREFAISCIGSGIKWRFKPGVRKAEVLFEFGRPKLKPPNQQGK